MISFIANRPVLQVGKQQVTGYDTQWIRESLTRASNTEENRDLPFIDELINGILHYLENKCALSIVSIETIHARICNMLKRVGLEAMADALPLLAPPITISLKDFAQRAGNGFELAFFNELHDEIEDLRIHGVETINFTHSEDCVKILKNSSRWTNSCKSLHQEIISFIENHHQKDLVTAC